MLIRTLFVYGCWFMLLPAAVAASDHRIMPSEHPNCDLELRGEIGPGIADELSSGRARIRLDRVIDLSGEGYSLCLDSPGGSLSEAMEMFEAIREKNITTVIPSGWRCESACAIAFMAGSISLGLGVPVTDRSHLLYPGGVLGFHAPSLDLPHGRSHSPEEVMRAFELALQASALLYRSSLEERGGWRSFNEYLYSRLIETVPNDMYRIETIGDAVLAEITLGPIKMPGRITEREIEHLCDAAYIMGQGSLQGRVPVGTAGQAWQYLRGLNLWEERRTWLEQTRSVELIRQGSGLIGRVGGYNAGRHYATGCEVEIDATAASRQATLYSNEGVRVRFHSHRLYDLEDRRVDGSSPLATRWEPEEDSLIGEFHAPLWYMHDPSTPIASLAVEYDLSNVRRDATHIVYTRPGGMVNLRAGPGTDHPVLREVPHGKGVVASRLGDYRGWVDVELSDGTSGWISGRLLAPL